MTWIDRALNQLAGELPCGYQRGGARAVEPTAVCIMALAGAGRRNDALLGLRWLSKIQRSEGSVPPLSTLNWPGWPTPLSIVATVLACPANDANTLDKNRNCEGVDLSRAREWLLGTKGEITKKSSGLGHNTKLIGWPWVVGTHAWQEPTAWSVLALKSLGLSDHPRTREGVRLLVDRLLATGGCNYGNTVVLGQRLRPHVEPTGLTMLAIADEKLDDPRIERSLRYLQSALSVETTPISLAYGLLGLAAFNRTPAKADDWLAAKYGEVTRRDNSPLKLALLTLAAQGRESALVQSEDVRK